MSTSEQSGTILMEGPDQDGSAMPPGLAGELNLSAPADAECLLRAVESAVIPRLLGARREAVGNPGRRLAPEEVEPLVAAVAERAADDDHAGALAMVEEAADAGASIDSVYTDILAGAARRLGEDWETDRLGFLEVSLGLCALHRVMYRLSDRFRRGSSPGDGGRSILIVPAPAETHFFGALMAAEFFAREGWRVWSEIDAGDAALARLVTEERFDLLGVSVSCEEHLAGVTRLLGVLADAGAPVPPVILGGRVATLAPEAAIAAGADAVVGPAGDAVAIAERMLAGAVP